MSNIELDNEIVSSVINNVINELCKKCRNSRNHPVFDVQTYQEFLDYMDSRSEEEQRETVTLHDKNGYCFLHYMTWKYAKEKNPDFLAILNWVVDHFDRDFLLPLYCEGIPDDELSTPIHYMARALPYLSRDESAYFRKLEEKGLRDVFDREDSSDMTVDEIFALKKVSFEIKKNLRDTQHEMKTIERRLHDFIVAHCEEYFSRCYQCNGFLRKVKDIHNIPAIRFRDIITPGVRRDIEKVIALREKVAQIYESINPEKPVGIQDRTRSHQFCLIVWKNKIEQLDQNSNEL